MKVLIVIAVVLFIGACSKTFTQHHVREALEYCKDKEGLYWLTVYDGNEKYVTCKNGSRLKLKEIHPN